jgi:hypothetical protein
MATKKSNEREMKIQVAEIRGETKPGQPEMIWHLPFIVTSGGATAALKGVELAAKGVQTAIEAEAPPPLQFEVRGSWLDGEGHHRVDIRMINSTKNGIYIESIDVKREYLDPKEIDPNRITQPTLWPGSSEAPRIEPYARVLDLPLLLLAADVGRLQMTLPSVDRKKMKSERAVTTVTFADLGKGKSDTAHFEFRLRWHDL